MKDKYTQKRFEIYFAEGLKNRDSLHTSKEKLKCRIGIGNRRQFGTIAQELLRKYKKF